MGHYIFIGAVLVVGLLALLYLEKSDKGEKGLKEERVKSGSASDFVNVYDIKGDELITKDGYIIKFLRIYPISVELFSDREK